MHFFSSILSCIKCTLRWLTTLNLEILSHDNLGDNFFVSHLMSRKLGILLELQNIYKNSKTDKFLTVAVSIANDATTVTKKCDKSFIKIISQTKIYSYLQRILSSAEVRSRVLKQSMSRASARSNTHLVHFPGMV